MFYQLAKFQYQISITLEDIQEYVFLHFHLDTLWCYDFKFIFDHLLLQWPTGKIERKKETQIFE